MTVAPVVVKPEIDSKTASVRLRCSPRMKGKAPTSPSTAQKSATIRKPSWTESSLSARMFGSHSSKPALAVARSEFRKTVH